MRQRGTVWLRGERFGRRVWCLFHCSQISCEKEAFRRVRCSSYKHQCIACARALARLVRSRPPSTVRSSRSWWLWDERRVVWRTSSAFWSNGLLVHGVANLFAVSQEDFRVRCIIVVVVVHAKVSIPARFKHVNANVVTKCGWVVQRQPFPRVPAICLLPPTLIHQGQRQPCPR